MDSISVLPLTAEAHDYFWLPQETDGAIVPGDLYRGSHLEDVIHVVRIHRNAFHKPPHSGSGNSIEGTVAP